MPGTTVPTNPVERARNRPKTEHRRKGEGNVTLRPDGRWMARGTADRVTHTGLLPPPGRQGQEGHPPGPAGRRGGHTAPRVRRTGPDGAVRSIATNPYSRALGHASAQRGLMLAWLLVAIAVSPAVGASPEPSMEADHRPSHGGCTCCGPTVRGPPGPRRCVARGSARVRPDAGARGLVDTGHADLRHHHREHVQHQPGRERTRARATRRGDARRRVRRTGRGPRPQPSSVRCPGGPVPVAALVGGPPRRGSHRGGGRPHDHRPPASWRASAVPQRPVGPALAHGRHGGPGTGIG